MGYKKFLSDCREGSRNKWIYAFLDLEERVEREGRLKTP